MTPDTLEELGLGVDVDRKANSQPRGRSSGKSAPGR